MRVTHITLEAAARALGCKVENVYQLIHRKELSAVKRSRTMVDLADLGRLLEKRAATNIEGDKPNE
jgi:excisionase family DNA binding protein